jgi:hypothetical protein
MQAGRYVARTRVTGLEKLRANSIRAMYKQSHQPAKVKFYIILDSATDFLLSVIPFQFFGFLSQG